MTPPTTCPLCGGALCFPRDNAYGTDGLCEQCGLAGPLDVLEKVRVLGERAEWAEAVSAALLPYQERAVLAEKASAEMREVLSAIVYWHDQGNGHIDASWWDAARKLLEDDHG